MYSKSIVGDGWTLRVRQRGMRICLSYPFLRSTVAHLISSHVDALTARRGSSLTFRLAIPLNDENVGQSLFEQWYYEHPNYSLFGVARRCEHSEHFERWGGEQRTTTTTKGVGPERWVRRGAAGQALIASVLQPAAAFLTLWIFFASFFIPFPRFAISFFSSARRVFIRSSFSGLEMPPTAVLAAAASGANCTSYRN